MQVSDVEYLNQTDWLQQNFKNSMSQRKGSKTLINVYSAKTNQQNLTPPRRIGAKSPFSNSKCSHQTQQAQTVSYGQLQIVLQNLQNIKQKASQQVQLLNQQNTALRNQIAELRHLIEELNGKYRQKDVDGRREEQQLREKVKQYERQLQEKERVVRTLEISQTSFQEMTDKQKSEIAQLKQKWTWAFTILAGDESQADELVWKIKQTGVNLYELLQTQTSLSSKYEDSSQHINSLTRQLSSSKQQQRKSSQMLDKSLNELKTANDKNTALEEKIREYSEILLKSQEEQVKLEKQIEEVRRYKDESEVDRMDIQRKVEAMSQELAVFRQLQLQKNKKSEYLDLVGQICDQTQDYSKVLQRLHYLQRFRGEHYKNVQKLQHLCKLLD